MQKILNISPSKPDGKTGAIVKEIKTTVGDFYSKSCVYNQTLILRERYIFSNVKQKLNGPPFYIRSIKFRLKNEKFYENIKSLTLSRKRKTLFYKLQVGIIKKFIEANKDKILVINFPFFKEEWKELTKEDIISLVKLQVDVGLHYINVPLFPNLNPEANFKLIKECSKLLLENQELIPCLNMWSLYKDFIELLSKILVNFNIKCLLVSCKELSSEKSEAILSYLDTNFPKAKLLIGVDVKDSSNSKNKRLCYHHLLRSFSFDLTCREVYFPLSDIDPSPVEKKRLYHEGTGAMFNEKEQENWDGVSFTDYIINNYPAECNLKLEDFFICLNFKKLNKTGFVEVNNILDNTHSEYINNKTHIQALWVDKKEYII